MNTGSLIAIVAVLVAAASAARAQDSAFVGALRSTAHRFSMDSGAMRGPGADALAEAARDHQFLLVGEDHGIRELPEFVAALWDVARPLGYRHLVVETGPVTGERLEAMLRGPDPMGAVGAVLARHTAFSLPFFFWKEESAMLAHVVASLPGAHNVVWGIDQEFMMAPAMLLERLAALARNPAARALAERQAAAARRGDSLLMAVGKPSGVWMVAATDSDVARLRAAFGGNVGAEGARIVEELAVSREIYAKYQRGLNYESNLQRSELMKRHFGAYYAAAEARGERMPRAVVKLGANHVIRGPSATSTYEMGSLLPELAAAHGTRAFGILVVVARGTQNAYRPFGSTDADRTKPYDPLTYDDSANFDLRSVLAASGSTWTYMDLRPIRARMQNGGLGGLADDARHLLLSFDAVVVVPEGHASVMFR